MKREPIPIDPRRARTIGQDFCAEALIAAGEDKPGWDIREGGIEHERDLGLVAETPIPPVEVRSDPLGLGADEDSMAAASLLGRGRELGVLIAADAINQSADRRDDLLPGFEA